MSDITVTAEMRESYLRQIVPFGFMDIDTAISTAINAGHTADWAAEQVREFMDSCDITIDKVDPVACVYDGILNEARTEIETETGGYDFINDGEGSICTAGNYMCTEFDYRESDVDKLRKKIKKSGVNIEELSENTRYFLQEIGIEPKG